MTIFTPPTFGTATPNGDGTVDYDPDPDANGVDTFVYSVCDLDLMCSTATVTVTVTAVNDEPSFSDLADQTVLEDSGDADIKDWAFAFDPGAPDEAGQSVTFSTIVDDPTLFATQPVVRSDGDLELRPQDDAVGTALVAVIMVDDGGTANGGDDTSASTSFQLTITDVNDEPSFAPGTDVSVLEDSGAFSAAWATGISTGPPSEPAQTVTFAIVGSSNPGLFAAAPAIAPDGTLTFIPAGNAFGDAVIDVEMSDDGGIANGGEDTTAIETFQIEITDVNDDPVAGDDNETVDKNIALVFSVMGNDGDPLDGDPVSYFSYVDSTADGTLVDLSGGSFSYTPDPTFAGVDGFTYTISDGRGGFDTASVTLDVVNTAPVANPDDPGPFAEDAPQAFDVALQVVANDTDLNSDPLTFVVAGFPKATAQGGTIDCSDGVICIYTPPSDYYGPDSFTYTIQDDSGAADSGSVALSGHVQRRGVWVIPRRPRCLVFSWLLFRVLG